MAYIKRQGDKRSLYNNQITIIRNNAFNGLANIKTIDLESNNISTIEANAFNGLTKLERL
ncbi:leucine-rich repeat-containing protein 17-like [Saccostrea cucullata]|uniref:leucine-rich repeat-containing protein 17-like n=1 Tax=Saccostrea cuccullata TaxID=36930 RepID=UPI002ED3C72E